MWKMLRQYSSPARADDGSCASVSLLRRLISRSPSAPSPSMPDNTTPAASSPRRCASAWKKSIDRQAMAAQPARPRQHAIDERAMRCASRRRVSGK